MKIITEMPVVSSTTAANPVTIFVVVFIAFAFVVCCIFGLITNNINKKKGYKSGFAWGFFLNIMGLLIVALRPTASHKSVTIEGQLSEAKSLLDKGMITNDEYNERRKKILENVN